MSNDLFIDLSNYRDRVGGRVAPGTYRVVVDDVEQDTAKSGNTMINLWLRILDEGDQQNSVVMDRLVLTENSLFRVVGFMQAIGMPTPKKRLKVNIKQFLGKSLKVDLDDGEPFMGRVKSEVRSYMPIGKHEQAAAPPDVLEGLEAEAEETGAVDLDSIDL